MNKFLLTQSLLSAWNWSYKTEDGQESFLKTLNREPIRPNKAMLDGQHFENMVYAYCEGANLDPRHQWATGIQGVARHIHGAQYQVKLSKTIVIDNVEFVLYGILDALKAGTVYDVKFSAKHKPGKYLDSPQHPMYLEICPAAHNFVYLASNGEDVTTENYAREDTPSIISEIKQFMKFLDNNNLTDTYCEKWKSKY